MIAAFSGLKWDGLYRPASLVSRAATINAKRFEEEKKAVGASILEFLFAVFLPAECGRTNTV
jgi:hypothetical protein